ncbi:alpha/beta fold hydrolase [Mesorhizobium sp. J428]|uniref:alpha/beta fold hydrolase n=1 Tax=Mesorhizobium sp. J428 TaxID=2898440 RepID=UPI0021511DD2|nr:alpha/beta fold hydrolase [Mesorhizobium sp. J428]MCR5858898.1 alpha/beta fold hydrolase [Mesorhizobium sp. J428]
MRTAVTRYAKSGEARIAYQVVGHGTLDLALIPGFPSNLEILWEDADYSRLVKRLSAFCRLILFQPRGSGLSDGIDPRALPDPRALVDDIRSVMDAAGCGRAALLGASDGAAQAISFAATYPERTRALVLAGGYAFFPDAAADARRMRANVEATEATWGTGASLARMAPGRADDRAFADWWARLERLSASPTAALLQARTSAALDVRGLLPAVAAPALLLHRSDDAHVRVESSRQLARALKDARLVELPGRDHPVWMGDVDSVADLVEEFLTGERSVAHGDRVLAVLLVARVVGTAGGLAAAVTSRHLQERMELFREALPRIVTRHGGYGRWSGSDRIDARFNGAARAASCAIVLRETAASLGLAIAQGIHVGEIDMALEPLSGEALDVADRIAAAARHADIMLSRLASELVSGSGLQFLDRGRVAVDGMREPLPIVALASERHLEPLSRSKVRPTDLGILSPREREVLELVADGLSNPHIAVQLGLSEHTVKRHVANILLKLDMPTRAAAAGLVARRTAQ